MHHSFGRISIYFFLILVIAVSGCSDDDPAGPSDQQPEIPLLELFGPETDTHDEGYFTVQGYINAITSSSQYAWIFLGLPGARNNQGDWEWAFTIDGVTSRLVASYNNDGTVSWKLTLNGTDSQGTTFDNRTIFEGVSSADGKEGRFSYYAENTGSELSRVEWETAADETITALLTEYNQLSGAVDTRSTIVNKPDKSGSFKTERLTSGTFVLTFDSEWDANGEGWWKRFDSQGNVESEGIWE